MPEPSAAAWLIERLDRTHERSAFDCGNRELSEWLQSLAGQSERRGLARTFVAVRADNPRVWGYYALANHCVRYDALPADQAKGLPTMDIPVVLLGRLAVDRTLHRQGLGAHLLIDALRRVVCISGQVGIRAVEVHASDDHARDFYRHFGFVSLLDDDRHLLLSLNIIRKLDLESR